MATATKENGVTKTADPSTAIIERETAFVPFMGKEEIRLSVSIVKKLICVKTRNGRICDDREAIRFIMLCKARGLNPFEGDAYLTGYENNDGTATFSLITAHQAFLKRAETHPEYDGMESGVMVVDKDKALVDREGDFTLDSDTIVGGWATVYFKNRSHPMTKRLKLSTFSTGKSRWSKDPAGMIVKCAEADALRSSFPTQLGGMYLEDELSDLAGQVPDLHPKNGKRAVRSSLSDEIAGSAAAAEIVDVESSEVGHDDADDNQQQESHGEQGESSDTFEDRLTMLSIKLDDAADDNAVRAAKKWFKTEPTNDAALAKCDEMCQQRTSELNPPKQKDLHGA